MNQIWLKTSAKRGKCDDDKRLIVFRLPRAAMNLTTLPENMMKLKMIIMMMMMMDLREIYERALGGK